jgi:hypothetical protein
VLIWLAWSIAFNPENLIPLVTALHRRRKTPIPPQLARFAPQRRA